MKHDLQLREAHWREHHVAPIGVNIDDSQVLTVRPAERLEGSVNPVKVDTVLVDGYIEHIGLMVQTSWNPSAARPL
jgi:hypothetical protein